MTGRAIGELLAGTAGTGSTASAKKVWVGNVRRTFQPVRRNSYQEGEREKRIWKPFGDGSPYGGRRFVGAYLRAAEEFELKNKEPGKVNGPLGHVGLQVLKALLQRADFRTGRLEPAIDAIMGWTRRSRAAVCNALARLKAHGFIDWIRRTAPVEDPEPFGQQVRQISNAYGIDIARLPREVTGFLRRLVAASPPPDDAAWAREQDAADTEAMHRSVPLSEAGDARHPDDPALAAAINRLGAAIEAAEARDIGDNASSPDGQNPGDVSHP